MAATETRIWPSSPIDIPTELRELITDFFEISDSTDPSSGERLAQEIFTSDGVLQMGTRLKYSGSQGMVLHVYFDYAVGSSHQPRTNMITELEESRKTMHPAILSRKHKIGQVYASNSPATDVMVLGSVQIQLKDGNEVTTDFTVKMVLDDTLHRLSFVQLWSDPTLMIEAFKKASAALATRE